MEAFKQDLAANSMRHPAARAFLYLTRSNEDARLGSLGLGDSCGRSVWGFCAGR